MTTVVFVLGDVTVPVAVEDDALADAVATLFRPLVRPGAPAGEVPALTVAREGSAYRLQAPGPDRDRLEHRFPSLPDLLTHVEYAVARRLLDGGPATTRLHAAGAVKDGRALLALGEAGAGKSSVALAWARAGLPLLGDDTLLVDARGRVTGLPRLVKVDHRVLEAHGMETGDTVAAQDGNPELWWDPARGGGWATGPVGVAVVARVRWVAGEVTRVRSLTPAEGLRVLLDNLLTGGLPPAESVDRLVEMVESAVSVEVSFGASVDGARALAALASRAER